MARTSAIGIPAAALQHGDSLDGADTIERAIVQRVPSLHREINNCLVASVICCGQVLRATTHTAVRLLVNQAVNDLHDLLTDIAAGRGRPATRTARALVEHAVNLSAVAVSRDLADRYVRHAAIRDQVEAHAQIGIDRLTGKDRKREAHRLRKLMRESAAVAAAAKSEYGNSYAANWAPENLKDRAEQHGLHDLYAYYRMSSMVLHGSAGGAAGTVSNHYENTVHRTGPALSLCVNAYHEGLRAFSVVANVMREVAPVSPHATLSEATAALLKAWPDYRRAILEVDEWLWPPEAPIGPMSVLCVFRNGERRWYWYQPSMDLVVLAEDPDPAALEPFAAKLDDVVRRALPLLDPADACLSITVAGLTLTPRLDQPALPATGLLVPKSTGRLIEEHV